MKRSSKIKSLRGLSSALLYLLLALWGTCAMAQQSIPGEGPPVTGSDVYRDGGANGSGIKIAIIDNAFASLTTAQASGDAPLTFGDTVDFKGGGITGGSNTHGTAVLEIIYDHAPGAEYYLYKVSSGLNASQLQKAVDSAVAKDVDIISMSITFYNQGWEDGSGAACAAVQTATDAGILVFAAAGNSGQQHWRGMFDDPDSDNLHNWSGVDEHQDVRLGSGRTLVVYLQWDLSGGNANYDLYIYDSLKTTILASSTESGNTYEDATYTNPGPGSQLVKIRVRRVSGNDATTLQLFARDGTRSTLQYTTAGSITSPSNSAESNVISVGAVDVDTFTSPTLTTGIIRSYSSQGPTNSGNTKPNLCSATNCTTVTRLNFGGTSCATPNAAGTAAAFWSSAPSLSASGVRYLLLEMAEIFKDWGPPGFDNTYGRGGTFLHTYQANTVWVDRRAGNTPGSDTIPYYYVTDAQTAAVSGGRIVFLGQSYPEPVVLNKELLYETIGWSALLGKE